MMSFTLKYCIKVNTILEKDVNITGNTRPCGHNLSQICETASTELDKLFRRLQVNKLSLNIAKIKIKTI